MMMCIYDSVYMPICVLCIVTNNQVVRLQFMAKISGLDVHLIEKSRNIPVVYAASWARSDSSAITCTRTR